MKCIRCTDTNLELDLKYKTMIEGSKKSEPIIRLLTEKLKKIENDNLPSSFVVENEKMLQAESIKQANRGRKRDAIQPSSLIETRLMVKIVEDESNTATPLVIKVNLPLTEFIVMAKLIIID